MPMTSLLAFALRLVCSLLLLHSQPSLRILKSLGYVNCHHPSIIHFLLRYLSCRLSYTSHYASITSIINMPILKPHPLRTQLNMHPNVSKECDAKLSCRGCATELRDDLCKSVRRFVWLLCCQINYGSRNVSSSFDMAPSV
jgi:hypothetical protein